MRGFKVTMPSWLLYKRPSLLSTFCTIVQFNVHLTVLGVMLMLRFQMNIEVSHSVELLGFSPPATRYWTGEWTHPVWIPTAGSVVVIQTLLPCETSLATSFACFGILPQFPVCLAVSSETSLGCKQFATVPMCAEQDLLLLACLQVHL